MNLVQTILYFNIINIVYSKFVIFSDSCEDYKCSPNVSETKSVLCFELRKCMNELGINMLYIININLGTGFISHYSIAVCRLKLFILPKI